MEFIPKRYKDPESGTVYDLTKIDLPKAATFRCVGRNPGDGKPRPLTQLQIGLIPKDQVFNASSQVWERVDDTGCWIKCKGGHLAVTNKKLLELLMDSDAYQKGEVQINPEDPTGFWREAGAVTVEEIKTYRSDLNGHPGFKEIDLKAVKKPVEGEELVPLSRVI